MTAYGIDDARIGRRGFRRPAAATRCAYCGGTITDRDYHVESCPHCGGPTNIPENQPPDEEWDYDILQGDDVTIAVARYPRNRG